MAGDSGDSPDPAGHRLPGFSVPVGQVLPKRDRGGDSGASLKDGGASRVRVSGQQSGPRRRSGCLSASAFGNPFSASTPS